MDPTAVLERVLDQPHVAYVREVLDTYGRAAGGLLANGLAYAALFAVIPIGLVTLGFAGFIAGDPEFQDALADALIKAAPPVADLIEGALQAVSSGAAAASILGLIGLTWAGSQFYVALDKAFSQIFFAAPERNVIHRTARGFIWVAILLTTVAALIIIGTLAVALEALLPGQIPLIPLLGDIVLSPPALIALAIGAVAVIYRVLPPKAPSWRSVGLPAIVVGVVILVLSQIFMFVAPRLVGVAALAGSLATAFIALAWLSFTFQALLYGAAWVRVREHRVRPGDRSALAGPAATAEPGGGGE